MDPLLARAVSGVSSRNDSSPCMNRLLPHKRLGLLEELMWDGATVLEPAVPTCSELENGLAYGSTLAPARKRAQQWRRCLRCENTPSLQATEFATGGERLRAATESASLSHLGPYGIRQIVDNRPAHARLKSHAHNLPIIAIVTGSSTRGQDAPSQPADISFLHRGARRIDRRPMFPICLVVNVASSSSPQRRSTCSNWRQRWAPSSSGWLWQ